VKRKDGTTVWWEATAQDLKDFALAASMYGAYGFWSLDWILTHNRTDYWEAITGVAPAPPPPPPEPLPEKEYKPVGEVEVKVDDRNIRALPSTSMGKIIGLLHKGASVPYYGLSADGLWYDCGGFWLYKSGTREV
jgi:hypothetical protein